MVTHTQVLILMGSDSDLPVMAETCQELDRFGIAFEVHVASAHRSPEKTRKLVEEAEGRGVKVLICAAGGAAHLAGTAAAHSTLPVLGIPINGSNLSGADALYSTVQMPPGVPVGTLALGKSGAINAAILAAQILALSDPALAARLKTLKKELAAKVQHKDETLQTKGWKNYLEDRHD